MKCKCGEECIKFPEEYLCPVCDSQRRMELSKEYVDRLLKNKQDTKGGNK